MDITVVQGFAPSVNMLKAAGINVVQDVSGKFDCAIVLLPKSKPQARDLIAQAVACVENGAIIVDGQKNDGIDSVLKELKQNVDLGVVISKAHGKCASFSSAHDLAHWRAKPIELSDGFQTYVGVFSADEADPASVLLAQHVKGHLKGRRRFWRGLGVSDPRNPCKRNVMTYMLSRRTTHQLSLPNELCR